MSRYIQNIIVAFGLIIALYFIFILTTAVLLFDFQKPAINQNITEKEIPYYMGDDISQDRVVLVQDRFESGLARVNLIESAKESLDISYYSINSGISGDLFFASILEAGNRGVNVRIILDGIANMINRNVRDAVYLFTEHPNIEVKYYQPLDLLQPWTWNHRLHDKLILVDDELAMIGGRNIGDKYFGREGYKGASNDRDVVIINTDLQNAEASVLYDIKSYVDEVWNHEFSKTPYTSLSKRQQTRANNINDFLQSTLDTTREGNPELFDLTFDWIDNSYPTNKITFLHNPLENLNSDPFIWRTIINLMEKAEQSIFIESPYIIPTSEMMAYLDKSAITAPEVTVHTNSLASTPNLFAYSGYTNYRDKLAKSNIQLYEYQSDTESVHAKTFVIDEQISLIGSFNLDPRSAFINTEVMVMIDSKPFAEHILLDNTTYIKDKSAKVFYNGTYGTDNDEVIEAFWGKKVVNWILSKIIGQFDYLL